jgi:hypothetical protein
MRAWETHTKLYLENVKQEDHLEDIVTDGSKALKSNLKETERQASSGPIRLRLGPNVVTDIRVMKATNVLATQVIIKLKLSHYRPWRRLGEEKDSSYSFSTSAQDGGEWSASRPGRALAPGKGPPVPIVQEAGWVSEPVWTKRLQEKSFAPSRGSNPDRPVVQPVVRHYTAWANPAHK